MEPQWRTKATHVEESGGVEESEVTTDNEKELEEKIAEDLESTDPVLVLPEAGMATAAIIEVAHHRQS